jgi:hypothetical protein
MSDTRSVLREVGALCGHPDPDKFADLMLAPACAHHGSWFFDDDEVCPEPCGRKHWWCAACFRPMKPECPIVDPE